MSFSIVYCSTFPKKNLKNRAPAGCQHKFCIHTDTVCCCIDNPIATTSFCLLLNRESSKHYKIFFVSATKTKRRQKATRLTKIRSILLHDDSLVLWSFGDNYLGTFLRCHCREEEEKRDLHGSIHHDAKRAKGYVAFQIFRRRKQPSAIISSSSLSLGDDDDDNSTEKAWPFSRDF